MSIDSFLTESINFAISNISLGDAAKIVLFNYKLAYNSAQNMLKSVNNPEDIGEINRKINSAYNSRLAKWIEDNGVKKAVADNAKNIVLSMDSTTYCNTPNTYYFTITYKRGDFALKGEQIIRYSSGQIALRFEYNRGGLDGQYIKYYQSGRVWLEGVYNAGMRYGKFTRYYNNTENSINKIQYWNNNKPYGMHREFYINGQIREIIAYNADGIAYYSGDKHVIYHSNGSIEAEIPVKNGQLHGRLIHKYKNGKTKIWGFYNLGKLAGPYFEYDESGKETRFIQYNPHGKIIN
jgi:antitoxin component YwqK of YwqJK toxin-antitoxin module